MGRVVLVDTSPTQSGVANMYTTTTATHNGPNDLLKSMSCVSGCMYDVCIYVSFMYVCVRACDVRMHVYVCMTARVCD